MKKLFIQLIAIIITSKSMQAQHTGLYFGVNGAFQKSSIICSSDSDESDNTGLLEFENTYKQAFGFELGYKVDPHIDLQTGMIFSEQGQKYSTRGNPIAIYETNLSYTKIPILLRYNIWPHHKFSVISEFGFQLSILTKANSSRKYTDSVPFGYYSPKSVDAKYLYSSLPTEIVAGIGFQYRIDHVAINLMLRGDFSITDIENSDYKRNLRAPASNFTLALPQMGIQYYFN